MFIFGNINQRSQAKDNLKSQIKNQIRIEKLKQISMYHEMCFNAIILIKIEMNFMAVLQKQS